MLVGQLYSVIILEQQLFLLSQLVQVSLQVVQDQQQQFQSQEDCSCKELYGMVQGWKKVLQQYCQGYYEKYFLFWLVVMGMGEQLVYDEVIINGVVDQIIVVFGQ